MRLLRPYIPYRLRIQVAEREYKKRFGVWPGTDVIGSNRTPLKTVLGRILVATFGHVRVHLDHDPALCNRSYRCTGCGSTQSIDEIRKLHPNALSCCPERKMRYEPDANDPDFLVYRTDDEHDIKTRVRGDHGQHSDLALRRKRKRKERKARLGRLLRAAGKPVNIFDVAGGKRKRLRKLRSRGFDKTRTRHFNRTVTPRQR